jgi:uncharacterized protein YcfJ
MPTTPARTALVLTALSLASASWAQSPARTPSPDLSRAPVVVEADRGTVLSVTPIVQQVAVPRQACTDEAAVVQRQPSGAGALMGAIAGGAMGNAVGAGAGRAAATAIGIIGGAAVGNSIEAGGAADPVRTVRRCSTQTSYEDRTTAYRVVYEYAGREYTAQMRQDPGHYVQVRVQPVADEGDAPPQYAPPARSRSVPPAASRPPPVYVERPVYQEYREPAYRSYPAPTVVYDEPVSYGRSYYEPGYPQFGTGLVLGALIGYGVNRHAWRGGYRH